MLDEVKVHGVVIGTRCSSHTPLAMLLLEWNMSRLWRSDCDFVGIVWGISMARWPGRNDGGNSPDGGGSPYSFGRCQRGTSRLILYGLTAP